MIRVVREAHAALDPQTIGVWLVREMNEWIPAPCWALVAPDLIGRLALEVVHGDDAMRVAVVAIDPTSVASGGQLSFASKSFAR